MADEEKCGSCGRSKVLTVMATTVSGICGECGLPFWQNPPDQPLNQNRILWVLRRIMTDLPAKRDWLNPDVEREAQEILTEAAKLQQSAWSQFCSKCMGKGCDLCQPQAEAKLAKIERLIMEHPCGCYTPNDENWHSERCLKTKFKALIATQHMSTEVLTKRLDIIRNEANEKFSDYENCLSQAMWEWMRPQLLALLK